MIVYENELDDGRTVSVIVMIFNIRVCIGSELAYEDGWCYPQSLGVGFVVAAAASWDGEGDPPDGWIKQISTGRRRESGDPAKEYLER